MFRRVGRLLWGLAIFVLLFATASCGRLTELEAEGPSALQRKRPVAAYFDYSKLRVHGHTERDWVRSRMADEPEYPNYWARVVATLQSSFARGFGQDETLGWLAPGQPAPPGMLVMQIQVSRIRLGHYTPFFRKPTVVDVLVRWYLDGRVTDAVLVEAEAVGTAFQPTELSQIESAGEEAGETVRGFVEGHR